MNAITIWKLWNCGGRYYFGLHVFPPNYEIYSIASGTGKFYSKCYKVCHEAKDLKNLDHNWHVILHFWGCRFAHLTGVTIRDGVWSFNDVSWNFLSKFLSEKEILLISCLWGYVFGIFESAFQNHFGLVYYQKCLSFLMTRDFDEERISIVMGKLACWIITLW